MYDSVLKQLRDAGLMIDSFEADTNDIVRCAVESDKGKSKSGWYRIYSIISSKGNTYYAGVFGNWKSAGLPESGLKIEYDKKGLSPEDLAAIQQKQKEAQRAADNARKAKRQEAARRAADIWEKLPSEGASDYLARKKVAACGLRFSRGSVVVPVRSITGELLGLQFIAGDGNKVFLTGTAKAGAFHLIGELGQASCVVIAEGYATAASIHMATRYTVAVAFDAGNLARVAEAIRKQWPELTIIIAADADETGISKARLAVKKCNGLLSVPQFLAAQSGSEKPPSDFNDLHVLEGLEAVTAQINSAQAAPPPTKPKESKGTSQGEKVSGYVVSDRGVYWVGDGDEDTQLRVCDQLDILGLARTEDGSGWSLMVFFRDYDGREHNLLIPKRLINSEKSSQVIELLHDHGFDSEPTRKAKQHLFFYLQKAKPKHRIRLVNRYGWHGLSYLSPLGVIGDGEKEELRHLNSDKESLNSMKLKGSLEAWRTEISVYCSGNPFMLFGTSIPFAGPLLNWLGVRTIGFHVYGDSSLGKSTMAEVAASVCGGKDYVRTWNATANALEAIAAAHNDSFMVMDELSQGDALSLGNIIYQIGNEFGKARATDTGMGNRQRLTWRFPWLSNGEKTTGQILEGVGKQSLAGQEMRLLHLDGNMHPNEKERLHKGIFLNLHDFKCGAALSNYLKEKSGEHYGYPFYAYVSALAEKGAEERTQIVEYLRKKIRQFSEANLSDKASGQAHRAANAFAVIGECGELATYFGITGWKKGEAREAAATLFKHFLKGRGGEGNSEDNDIIKKVSLLLLTKARSNFIRWEKDEATIDTHQPSNVTCWGFCKITEGHKYGSESYSEAELFIYDRVFRDEICKGFDYQRACALLNDRGALVTTKGKGYMRQVTLPLSGSKQTRVYCIKLSALQECSPDSSNDDSHGVRNIA